MKLPGRDYPFVFIVPIVAITVPCYIAGTVWSFAVIGFASGMRGVANLLFAKERAEQRAAYEKEKEEAMEEMQRNIKAAISQHDGVDPDKVVIQRVPLDPDHKEE